MATQNTSKETLSHPNASYRVPHVTWTGFWMSGSRQITWTGIHISMWWTWIFLSVYDSDWGFFSLLSSLLSLQSTHIWWNVSELKMLIFSLFFFFFFLRWYWSNIEVCVIRIVCVWGKIKRFSVGGEGSAAFFSLTFFIVWKSPGRCLFLLSSFGSACRNTSLKCISEDCRHTHKNTNTGLRSFPQLHYCWNVLFSVCMKC